MKTKTISYLSSKLDRNMGPKPTFEQKVAKIAKHIKDVVWSMMQHPRKLEQHYENLHMAHIQLVMKRKAQKLMYEKWHAPVVKTHSMRVREAINYYKWQQSKLREGTL